FYLDVLKDRLYTAAPGSIARRSGQTALVLIRDILLKLMAPILSFTAEEAWRLVHGDDPTIFVRTWTDELVQEVGAEELVAKWRRILAVRGVVQRELEAVRQSGAIGSSLKSDGGITGPAAEYEAPAALR